MKNLLFGTLLSVLFLGSITSCDPCTGCGPVTSEPTVEATFYNIDSLIAVQDSIVIVDTLKIVVDSLLIVVDSIGKGGNLASERLALETYIDGLTHYRALVKDSVVADTLDYLSKELKALVTLINSGKSAISNLTLVNTGLSDMSDSAVKHYLPVFLDDESTNLTVQLGDEIFGLEFTYVLTDTYTEDRRVVRSALMNSLLQTGFDSLFCFCGSDTVECSVLDCDANSTSIKAYF